MAVSKKFKLAMDKERVKEQAIKDVVGFCFLSNKETENFASKCLKKPKTRFALNRLQWFVELSDSQCYDSVKVFFLIAMAERNIKLLQNDSLTDKAAVEKFFSDFTIQDKSELTKCFFRTNGSLRKSYLRFKTIVDILQNIRHEVVHGKNHYSFRFFHGPINSITGVVGSKHNKRKVRYELKLTYYDFKKLMIKNAVSNIIKTL